MSEKHSKAAIYGALFANFGIAVVKFIAAAFTGSSSMISEGVHSLVDTGNEALLLLGMRRSKAPPDELHRFGHGPELYFWSLIVAVLIFGVGGGISIYEGLLHVIHPGKMTNPTWNYIVLGVALLFEGASFLIALRSFKAATPSAKKRFWRSLVKSKDPALFVVLFEDGAAILGLIVAALGVYFSHSLNWPELDGIASIVIGSMLSCVAIFLIIESRHLLVGESADHQTIASVCELLSGTEEVARVRQMKTMHLGPHEILLVAKIDKKPDSERLVPEVTWELEQKIRERFPDIHEIYLDFGRET